MKKKLIVCAFLVLIAVTAIACISAAIGSYRYDMDPANGVDILAGFGAVLFMLVGGFVVLYELDLFFIVYYFCFSPKTVAKSVLNLLANLCFALCFFYVWLSDIFRELRAYEITLYILFLVYIGLRMVYFVIWFRSCVKDDEAQET